MKPFLVALILMFIASVASAATTRYATNSTWQDVTAKIAASSSGDTVIVPAGTNTWSTTVNSKTGVKLIATNQTTTRIEQSGTTQMMDISHAGFMVSGFTFVKNSDGTATSGWGIGVGGDGGRICSNRFELPTSSGGASMILVGDSGDSSLIDRNTVINTGSANVHFVLFFGDFGSSGTNNWTQGTTYGSTNYCYVEHNTITYSALSDGVFDAYCGAKFVIRYNTFTNAYFGWHGTDSGGYRSPHSYEIYGNNFYYDNGGYYAVFNSRGGTGLIFSNNVYGRTDGGSAFPMQYFRLTASYSPWGQMTGSNKYDGNEDGTGYPGLDQQGRTGPTTWFSDHSVQVLSPTYIWSNSVSFTLGADANIVAGRDYTNAVPAGYTPLSDPHPLAGYEGGGGGSSGGATATANNFKLYRP